MQSYPITRALTVFALTVGTILLAPFPSYSRSVVDVLEARLEQDLELLLTWSQGFFDNKEYVEQQVREGMPASHSFDRLGMRFTRVDDVPNFGGSVTLAQGFIDADKSKPSLTSLISYRISPEENGIEYTVNYILDSEAVINAHKDPSPIRALVQHEDTSVNNRECRALMRRIGDQFILEQVGGGCSYQFEGQRPVKSRAISMMSEDEHWIWSVGQYPDGSIRYGNDEKVFNVYKKVD